MLKADNTLRLKQLRVVGISIRNYQRLDAFDLDEKALSDGVITVCGENSHGKTSAAEAIALGFGLKSKAGLKQPVNRNAPEGKGYGVKIELGNPELAYTIQHWSEPDGRAAGFRIVRADDGSVVPNPASWMKEVLDGLRNPVDVLQMEPIKLRAELIRIGGVDVDALDAEIAKAREDERRADEVQKSALSRADRLPWHDDAPEAETSATEQSEKLQNAISDNAARDRQAEALWEARVKVESVTVGLSSVAEQLAAPLLSYLTDQAKTLLDSKVDTTQLQSQLANVEANNRKFRENALRIEAKKEWEAAEEIHKAAIETRKAAEAAKRKAIAEASFPVEGLGFDEKEVTFNGLPFSQAGNAERIRVAVAICLAGRGALPFLLIDNAEALDNKSLRLLIEEVDRQGAQCLAFFVANRNEDGSHDRQCEFYVVDGNLVKAPPKTEGKGGEGDASASQVPPPANRQPLTATSAPEPCPTCGGLACGAFCMNGGGD